MYRHFTTEQQKELVSWLEGLSREEMPRNTLWGVCDNRVSKFSVGLSDLTINLKEWKPFSGNLSAPIPSPNPSYSAMAYYCCAVVSKWGPITTEGQYRQLRRDFCGFLAEELKKQSVWWQE